MGLTSDVFICHISKVCADTEHNFSRVRIRAGVGVHCVSVGSERDVVDGLEDDQGQTAAGVSEHSGRRRIRLGHHKARILYQDDSLQHFALDVHLLGRTLLPENTQLLSARKRDELQADDDVLRKQSLRLTLADSRHMHFGLTSRLDRQTERRHQFAGLLDHVGCGLRRTRDDPEFLVVDGCVREVSHSSL